MSNLSAPCHCGCCVFHLLSSLNLFRSFRRNYCQIQCLWANLELTERKKGERIQMKIERSTERKEINAGRKEKERIKRRMEVGRYIFLVFWNKVKISAWIINSNVCKTAFRCNVWLWMFEIQSGLIFKLPKTVTTDTAVIWDVTPGDVVEKYKCFQIKSFLNSSLSWDLVVVIYRRFGTVICPISQIPVVLSRIL